MNNHVPYIWRKNYRNTGPWPEKVLQTCARKSAAVFEPCRFIINSLLQKSWMLARLVRCLNGLTTEAACE